MLDQLDDPIPFVPDAQLVAVAKQRGTRLRRRRHRTVAALVGFPVLVVAAFAAGGLYLDHRTDEVHRVEVASGALTPATPDQPFNVLVVGTDGPRSDATARTDTIMVVHVDEPAGRVRVLSIPRDLEVSDGGPRINSLLAAGGPETLIDAVRTTLDIPISHFVEIDEPGLARLIDQVGGVRMTAGFELHDSNSGFEMPAGCHTLDGKDVVALVRSRHIVTSAPAAIAGNAPRTRDDLDREADQQEVLHAAALKLFTMPGDFSTLATLVDVFADHTTIDAGLSRSELLDLVRWGRGLDPGGLSTSTLSVEIGAPRPDGSMVVSVTPTAAGIARRYLDGLDANAVPAFGNLPRATIFAGCS
jgi:LCP family protein required for cell wall assembly